MVKGYGRHSTKWMQISDVSDEVCDKLQNQEMKKKLEFFLNLIEKKSKCIVASNGNFNAPGIWYWFTQYTLFSA